MLLGLPFTRPLFHSHPVLLSRYLGTSCLRSLSKSRLWHGIVRLEIHALRVALELSQKWAEASRSTSIFERLGLGGERTK